MIAKLILCVFLIRATITDITKRKIENRIVIGMLIGRVAISFGNYWCGQTIIFDVNTTSSQLIITIVLTLFYFIGPDNIGAGDIKLLLAGQLFFEDKELIPWFMLMLISTMITSFIVGKQKRLPLAPFVLFSTLIITIVNYI